MSKPAADNWMVDQRTDEHLTALRTAAALVRCYDWRRVADLYRDHKFKPLAYLASACGDAMLSWPHNAIAPAMVLQLCEAQKREAVSEMFSIFGV